MLDFVEVASTKEDEEGFAERVCVNLRDTCAVGGAPQLIVAFHKASDQHCFIHSAVAVCDGF